MKLRNRLNLDPPPPPKAEEKDKTVDPFKVEFERRFPTLSYDFIECMGQIGDYGLQKYGDGSLAYKMKSGDFSRTSRTVRREIAKHANVHFEEYIDGILHDKFGTRKHQLAAAAFNPMMEFQLSRLENE